MKILFVTANRVGDAVLSTGLLAHLIKRYGSERVRFTVIAGPAAASLFAPLPGLEEVIVVEKRPLDLHWAKILRACLGRRWDLVVDLRRSALPWLLRAGERRVVPKITGPLHRVKLIAATLGLEADPPAPTLWTAPRDRKLAARLIPDDGPVLAVAPAANWPGKQWPRERFAELVRRLTGPGGIMPDARVAVLAAGNERTAAGPLLDDVAPHRRIDLIGGLDLPEVAACLKRCAFFVGNDSGLMHMAAAVGIPTLGLFGPSRPEHYAPWGAHAAYVTTAQSYEELVGAPGYDHRTTSSLMGSLSVDRVEDAARALWRKASKEAA